MEHSERFAEYLKAVLEVCHSTAQSLDLGAGQRDAPHVPEHRVIGEARVLAIPGGLLRVSRMLGDLRERDSSLHLYFQEFYARTVRVAKRLRQILH